ncbi:MAG: DNRLRE domain-containing protein [Dehalococcoidia bacterium]
MSGSPRLLVRWTPILLAITLATIWVGLAILPQPSGQVAAAPPGRPFGAVVCLNPVADALIQNPPGGGNFGAEVSLTVGSVNNFDTNPLTRSLLRFDLASIPPGQLIVSATLTLYARVGDAAPLTIGVHPVLTGWTESGVTWFGQPPHQATAAAVQTVGAPPGFVNWNVTQLVRDWYAGTSPNFGVKLVSGSEGSFNSRLLDSKERSGGNSPCLNVEFAAPTPTRTPTLTTTPLPGETFSPTPSPTQTGTPTVTRTPTPSPSATPCLASRPQVVLKSPTTGPAVQINKFLLNGSVSSPGGQLLSATFTVANDAGTSSKSINLLNEMLQPTGGTLGPILIYDMLFPLSIAPSGNVITLRAENCAGVGITTARLAFAPIDPSTRIVLERIEINQATQLSDESVPLVADKAAVARAYLRVDGPAQATSEIRQLSGALTAYRPDGSLLPGPVLLQSTSPITISRTTGGAASQLNFAETLNFRLPPEWVTEGSLHLELTQRRIQGDQTLLPCDNCDNRGVGGFPVRETFTRVPKLNLVLAPYDCGTVTSVELLLTPAFGLQWLNNVYPIAGNFPNDSQGIGLVRMLPARVAGPDGCKGFDKGDFLGELADRLDDLRSQSTLPSGTRILGMTPCGCGGMGQQPGSVSFGDSWSTTNGQVPSQNFGFYGAIWAQEVGHNLGRSHATGHDEPDADGNFPYPHGGIGVPGISTITNWWKGDLHFISPGGPQTAPVQPHAHDFMSYGSVTGGPHTEDWVSPYTYKALFTKLRSAASLEAQPLADPIEKVIVAGQLLPGNAVTLRPFRRVTTTYESSTGVSGDLAIELLDANRLLLTRHRFDAPPAVHGDHPATDFSEFVTWQAATRFIVLTRGGVALAERRVSANSPTVRLLSPNGGESVTGQLAVRWEAADLDGDVLTATVFYNSGSEPTWWPVASNVTGTSTIVNTALLPSGAAPKVRVRVSDGVNSAEDESDAAFTLAPKGPQVGIAAPTNGQAFATGITITLAAAAYDAEDGFVPDVKLSWSSSKDGPLGQGGLLSTSTLSAGVHRITVTATDSTGLTGQAEVTVFIGGSSQFIPIGGKGYQGG